MGSSDFQRFKKPLLLLILGIFLFYAVHPLQIHADPTQASATIGGGANGTVTTVVDQAGVYGNNYTIEVADFTLAQATQSIGSGANGTVNVVVDQAGVDGNDYTITVEVPDEVCATAIIGSGVNGTVTLTAYCNTESNGFPIGVAVAGAPNASPGLSASCCDVLVILGTDGNGDPDPAKNTATLIAAKINELILTYGSNISGAVASGNGSAPLTGPESTEFAGDADHVPNTELTVSQDGTEITVLLGTDANGDLDPTKNTAALIAAEINSELADVTATATGNGSSALVAAEELSEFTGGTGSINGDLTVTQDDTDIVIYLGTDGDGDPDGAKNTATLVAAEINDVSTDVTATASGNGSSPLTQAEGPTSFTGGVGGATLYFSGTANHNWNTRIGNWWRDAAFTLQAPSLPTVIDDVIISTYIDSNSGPAASVNTMTVNNNGQIIIPVTVANGATFNGTSYLFGPDGEIIGDVTFNDNSSTSNGGVQITGNATFNDNTSNNGAPISGDATFNDNSGNNGGTVSGDATFNDNSGNNSGTISGNAIFNDLSFNNGDVDGTAKFPSGAGGVLTMVDGRRWGGGYYGVAIVGNDNILITNWIFNGASNSHGDIPGDAIFNDLSLLYSGTISGDATLGCHSMVGENWEVTGVTIFTPCAPAHTFSGTTVLYGVDGSGSNPSSSFLYTLDPDTGDKINTIGQVGSFKVTGMAFDPNSGILYGTTGGQGTNPRSLIRINTTTGAGTLIGALKTGANQAIILPDISFRSNGILYGFSNAFGGDPDTADLYTVDLNSCNGTSDTNCLVTKVGDSGLNPYGNGLAFDSQDNLFFFGDGDESFWKINPDTGEVISEHEFQGQSQNYSINAAAFDGDDILYASRLNYGDMPADLIVINTESGLISSMDLNNEDMHYMDAIAFRLVPRASSGSSSTVSKPFTMPPQPFVLYPQVECGLGEKFNRVTGLLCQTKTIAPIIPTEIITPINKKEPKCTFISVLKTTYRGPGVKCLQSLLNLKADGIFGPTTKEAVILFQQNNPPLKPDGLVGPKTRAEILKGGN